jgi:hypothetical protein
MTTSKRIAGLIGPTLVVVTISETMNFHIWASNIAPVIHLNGALLFIAGLAIVQVHNRWTVGWPVMVTLTGWIGILGGLFRMFAPETQQSAQDTLKLALTAVVFLLGIFLTYQGYRREQNS